MIPYKTVNSIEEVKQIYPKFFGAYLYNIPKIKQFIKEELKDLKSRSKSKSVTNSMIWVSEARGVYRYLFCIDHITDQMVKFRRDPKTILSLINRMEKAHYDPWSTTEDTAGMFIEAQRARIGAFKGTYCREYAISDESEGNYSDDEDDD